MLFNLETDIGESTDVAASNPEVVALLQEKVAAMDGDLGIRGKGPGVRPLGHVENPKPLIDFDGTFRQDIPPATR